MLLNIKLTLEIDFISEVFNVSFVIIMSSSERGVREQSPVGPQTPGPSHTPLGITIMQHLMSIHRKKSH